MTGENIPSAPCFISIKHKISNQTTPRNQFQFTIGNIIKSHEKGKNGVKFTQSPIENHLGFCYLNGIWQTDHEVFFGNAAKIKKEKIFIRFIKSYED